MHGSKPNLLGVNRSGKMRALGLRGREGRRLEAEVTCAPTAAPGKSPGDA